MIESNKVKLFKCPFCKKIYKLVDKIYLGEIPCREYENLRYGYYITDFGDMFYYREYNLHPISIPLDGGEIKINYKENQIQHEILPICCKQFVENDSIEIDDWVADKVFSIKGEPF